jgi:hypothetical protein
MRAVWGAVVCLGLAGAGIARADEIVEPPIAATGSESSTGTGTSTSTGDTTGTSTSTGDTTGTGSTSGGTGGSASGSSSGETTGTETGGTTTGSTAGTETTYDSYDPTVVDTDDVIDTSEGCDGDLDDEDPGCCDSDDSNSDNFMCSAAKRRDRIAIFLVLLLFGRPRKRRMLGGRP